MVKISIIVQIFVLDTLHRNIMHLAVITRKTMKTEILKCGRGSGKEPHQIMQTIILLVKIRELAKKKK